MYKLKLVILFIVFLISVKAQKLFPKEVVWATTHPIAALKLKKIYTKVFLIYKEPSVILALDNFNNGGKLDAFRHVFFMAAFAQKIKLKKLRKLGIAHEKGNYKQFLKHQNEEGELPDSLSGVMDLMNNELGFKIGLNNKKINLEELKLVVIKEINNGNAVIVKRNYNKLYVDCNNVVIDIKAYEKKWHVPKCLISSK